MSRSLEVTIFHIEYAGSSNTLNEFFGSSRGDLPRMYISPDIRSSRKFER
ncbi:MAG: hypothetical protein PUI48_01735 [Oscillospiraceae bacterium]|nr:hypothetical protein [Oscillospiraceae bacterium]